MGYGRTGRGFLMRSHALTLILLVAAPLLVFWFIVSRDVPMAALQGIDAKCNVCDRKATRTLKRAMDELGTKGLYVFAKRDYPGGIPAWCDRHGPNKMRENSSQAYLGAILAFAAVGTAYERVRRRS